jgi:hypothetical protein
MRCFLGGTSKLLKAIGSHPSLRRDCNVLTLPLIAARVPISLPQIPLQALALPSAQISIPASTPSPCSAPKHATAPLPGFKLCHPACPERSRTVPKHSRPNRIGGAVCRCAAEGPRLPINHFTIRSTKPSPTVPLLPQSIFLILPIHFSSCGNSFFHLTLHFPSRYL